MLAFSGIATPTISAPPKLPALKAAVIVPGFLSDESDFYELAEALSADGIATAVVPMSAGQMATAIGHGDNALPAQQAATTEGQF